MPRLGKIRGFEDERCWEEDFAMEKIRVVQISNVCEAL